MSQTWGKLPELVVSFWFPQKHDKPILFPGGQTEPSKFCTLCSTKRLTQGHLDSFSESLLENGRSLPGLLSSGGVPKEGLGFRLLLPKHDPILTVES